MDAKLHEELAKVREDIAALKATVADLRTTVGGLKGATWSALCGLLATIASVIFKV